MSTDTASQARETVDAFHRGAFWLVQPKGSGHRSGVDAIILAAAVPGDFKGQVTDFGAGAGAAGMAVAARCPRAEVTLVELAPEMAAYAQKSLAHPGNRHLRDRVRVVVADVTLTGKARAEAGLADNSFDFAIMNPPFNAPQDRQTPDALKQRAHVMNEELFERWVRSAAAVVKPRGGLAVIARPVSLEPLLAAIRGRFGSAEIVPVHPRTDAAAIRIVLRATRAARGAVTLRPPLILHEATTGGFTARADDINNGRTSLFGD